MNILRCERLILVEPVVTPPDTVIFLDSPHRRLVACSKEGVFDASATAWKEGFLPVLFFEYADDIVFWTHEIQRMRRPWAAFGLDEQPALFHWLLQHPSMDVLRGMANRDFLILPDAAFTDALNAAIKEDREALHILKQLRDGHLYPSELERLPSTNVEKGEQNSRGVGWRLKWLLDRRVMLTIAFDWIGGKVHIRYQAEIIPPPTSLVLDDGEMIRFDENRRIVLTLEDDMDRIEKLVRALKLEGDVAVAVSKSRLPHELWPVLMIQLI